MRGIPSGDVCHCGICRLIGHASVRHRRPSSSGSVASWITSRTRRNSGGGINGSGGTFASTLWFFDSRRQKGLQDLPAIFQIFLWFPSVVRVGITCPFHTIKFLALTRCWVSGELTDLPTRRTGPYLHYFFSQYPFNLFTISHLDVART